MARALSLVLLCFAWFAASSWFSALAAPTASTASGAAPIVIRGRIVFDGGEPPPRVVLTAWVRGPFYEPQVHDPLGPLRIELSEEDLEGEFRVTVDFDGPWATLWCRIDAEGLAPALWELPGPLRGRECDLGAFRLVPTATLVGRLVDEAGAPLGAGWNLALRPTANPAPGSSPVLQAPHPIDPETGEFSIEDVPAGPLRISATADLYRRVEGPHFDLVPGTTHSVEIISDASNTVGGILVEAGGAWGGWEETLPFRLEHAGGRVEEPDPRLSDEHALFRGLLPGRYAVVLDDPRFLPWRMSDVGLGDRVQASLRGSAALRLTVVGPAGAGSVEHAVLRLRGTGALRESEWDPRPSREDAPEQEVISGVVPGDYVLEVETRWAEYPRKCVRIDGLAPGETRDVTVRLGGRTELRGNVRDSRGEPVSGIQLWLLEPSSPDMVAFDDFFELEWGSLAPRDCRWADHTSIETEGGFVFRAVPPGTYRVVAMMREGGAVGDPVTLVEDQMLDGYELELPSALSGLQGRVRCPEGVDPREFRIHVMGQKPRHQIAITRLQGDGRFRLGPVPEGGVRLGLLSPRERRSRGASPHVVYLHDEWDLGEVSIAESSERELVYDATKLRPVSFQVRVRDGGDPVPFARVQLHRLGTDDWRQAWTDDQGRVRIESAFPGTWILAVGDADASWLACHSEALVVAPGGEASCEFDLHIASGSLLCYDPHTNAPWADLVLSHRPVVPGLPEGVVVPEMTIRADAQGMIELRLPTGMHEFQPHFCPNLGKWPREYRVPVLWTEGGAAPPLLALTR